MNNILFTIKLFSINSDKSKRNYSLFIPFTGIVIGVFTFMITYGVMNGMENKVFADLLKIYPNQKVVLNNLNNQEIIFIKELLNNNNIEYYSVLESKCLINNNNYIRLINIKAIDKINKYLYNNFDIIIKDTLIHNEIIVGNELLYLMDLNKNDKINIISPADLNLFTLLPFNKEYSIIETFARKVMNYESNYGFINLKGNKKLFNKSGNNFIYIRDNLNNKILDKLTDHIPEIKILYWKEEYKELINAINLEKKLYSSFGFIIILLATFTFMNIISNIIHKKNREFGILKAVGFSNQKLQYITLSFMLIYFSVAFLFGIIISYIFIDLNFNYNIINLLLDDYLFIEYPILIGSSFLFYSFILGILIIIISSFYNMFLIKKTDITEAINYIN